jgi:periplasmic protein TonB
MFEDSLMESAGRIHTKSKWTALGSLLLEASILTVLLLLPEIYPEALPRQAMSRLLIAPPPPPAPPAPVQRPSLARVSSPQSQPFDAFSAPGIIPQHAALGIHDAPAPNLRATTLLDSGSQIGIPGALDDIVGRPIPNPMIHPAPPKGPLRVSSGVAAGQLLSPLHAVYPAIAKQARIQGTVVVEATINRQGMIENLRVVSGPALLQSAATDAIRVARYRPFLLNGEPVEVQPTINVIFSLGS